MTLDRRTTLARPDLADIALEGLVRAERFAAPVLRRCAVPSSGIRKTADARSEQLDQLLFGEQFAVLESAEGWAWGQAKRDGYVGFVAAGDLDDDLEPPTHQVSALRTLVFARADMKSSVSGVHSLNTLVRVEGHDGRFAKVASAGWIFEGHLRPVGDFQDDPAAVAERFIGAPYQWGGRESLGLDCSGLVQQALYACGRGCPRDSDQQRTLGVALRRDELGRGDLVFWSGHVAMMLDAARIIHANAFHMAVEVEPLAEAIARIERAGVGQPLCFRRL